jgi:CRISPR-associated protein Cas5d
VGAVFRAQRAAGHERRHGDLALYIEDERQQRAGLFLRDVAYGCTCRSKS